MTSADQLVSGSKYVISNSGTAGSAYFCGNATFSNYYRTAESASINDDLTMTPTSTIDEFTLGGAEGAWTFYSTKASGNGYLYIQGTYNNLELAADTSSQAIWAITLGTAGAVTIKNAAMNTNHYIQYNSSYTEFTTKTASANVYLFVEAASVLAPALSLSANTLSLDRGAAAATISVTTDSGATLNFANSSDSVANVSLSGSSISVTPVAEGTSTITVTASKDGYTRSAKCVVTVNEPKVVLTSSSITVVGIGVVDKTTDVNASHFADTVTYSVSSGNTSIATGVVVSDILNISTVAEGTTTLIVTASAAGVSKTASIAVTVIASARVNSVSVTGTSSLAIGQSVSLTAFVSVTGDIAETVNWSSSASGIASVNSSGSVTGVAAGSATITATSTADSTKSGSLDVTVTATAQDAWTIMIYMCGADLESNGQTSASSASGYATGDLKEIYNTRASLPSNVNVIVEAGGAKSWKTTYSSVISTSYLNRFHLTTSGYTQDAQITKANMGLASTFQSFLEWGLTSYPADRTMVVFWDHGGAMHGCCYDENYSDDALLNSEVHSALSGAFTSTGRTSKLECIG